MCRNVSLGENLLTVEGPAFKGHMLAVFARALLFMLTLNVSIQCS